MLESETGVAFRDQVTLSLVDHKEFGLYPKMDQKPLKDFGQGETVIRFVFSKLRPGCCVGGGHKAGPEVDRSESRAGIYLGGHGWTLGWWQQ